MPILDPFSSEVVTRGDATRNAMEITPSDTQDLPVLPTFVWAERDDGGPIALRMQFGGAAVTLNSPGITPGPSVFPGLYVSPTRIFATGTSASKIILFW